MYKIGDEIQTEKGKAKVIDIKKRNKGNSYIDIETEKGEVTILMQNLFSPSVYPLRDIMTCFLCGNSIIAHKSKDRRYYRCSGYGKSVCNAKTVYSGDIEEKIKEYFLDFLRRNNWSFIYIEDTFSIKYKPIDELKKELKILINEKSKLLLELKNGFVRYIETPDGRGQLLRNNEVDDAIANRINELTNKIEEINCEIDLQQDRGGENKGNKPSGIHIRKNKKCFLSEIESFNSGSSDLLNIYRQMVKIDYSIIHKQGLIYFSNSYYGVKELFKFSL